VVRAKVDTWVSDEREDPAFGLDGDTCHFVLGFEDGNKPLTVFLGAAGEGGVYGRTDASAGVFVAPRALRELAERIYVSRGSMRVPPSLIERVTVTRDGRRVAGLDAAALRDAASTLVADRVVAVGAPKLVRPDLVVEIAVAEAGARGMKRVSCGAGRNAGERFCAVDGVAATFAVPLSRLATFLGLRGDAGE
jgi:hypothetical protein